MPPRGRIRIAWLGVAGAALALAACVVQRPLGAPPGAAAPPPPAGYPAEPLTPAPPAPGAPAQPPHAAAAARALISEAHAQADRGAYAAAGATLERALRIEPTDPVLWIELGRLRLANGDADQAESLGRKALTLAAGDPSEGASAWRLIADSLKSRGRNAEAVEAERRALGLSPR